MDGRRAILVGVSGRGDVPDVGVADGVRAVEDTLVRRLGWPSVRVSTFVDSPGFLGAVRPLLKDVRDVLLVCFVGGGRLLPENEETLRDLLAELRDSPARTKIVVLDHDSARPVLAALDGLTDDERTY